MTAFDSFANDVEGTSMRLGMGCILDPQVQADHLMDGFAIAHDPQYF